ncbi:hypothetical protein THRCLA_21474 [Thraustotheca clavata]|uniref:Tc1-like transposase DDE domain-containing protein n=1 Tax=Thraustotheca clavata TaxID=74557 RepID=A0A1V9ZWQ4_9STRA|nr:hypothetical protein THRCLA_21474 [Thraustotheca clavata]
MNKGQSSIQMNRIFTAFIHPISKQDQSYIHHHYTSHHETIYHPDDHRDAPKKMHKGRRYCFNAAILDDGENDSRVLALDIFEGGKKDKKVVKDYHKMFDHSYYCKWFNRLLDELDALGKKKAIIVMNNASYHKSNPIDTPKYYWRKDLLFTACNNYGIQVNLSETKASIWTKIASYILTNVQAEILSVASNRGYSAHRITHACNL